MKEKCMWAYKTKRKETCINLSLADLILWRGTDEYMQRSEGVGLIINEKAKYMI